MLLEIAQETGLDVNRLRRDLERDKVRPAILERARVGQERYGARGTPTTVVSGGTMLRHAITYAQMRDSRVIGVMPLPCRGDECIRSPKNSSSERSVR